MQARFGSVLSADLCYIRLSLYNIPVLSKLNPPKMASSSSAVNDSVILTKDDIPGASLAGQNPSLLKNEELPFSLRDAM